jgi:hypothetical protein
MDQSYASSRSATESRSSKDFPFEVHSPRASAVETRPGFLAVDRQLAKAGKAKTSKKVEGANGFWGRRTEIEIPEYWTGPGW